jgi:hypothetical protein
MSAHEGAQVVHRLIPKPGETGEPVTGPDGQLYNRVPNHCDRVYWWFDADWRPAPDPFAPPPPPYDPHREANEAGTIARCYFIGGDEGPVKIGYSIDVPKRLRTLQLSSPVTLKVLAETSGGVIREAAYHGQFSEIRLWGEWFERAPELEAEIARLNAQGSA